MVNTSQSDEAMVKAVDIAEEMQVPTIYVAIEIFKSSDLYLAKRMADGIKRDLKYAKRLKWFKMILINWLFS